jgi:predicted nucleic acid-binding protein
MEAILTPPELATHEKLRILIQGNAESGRHDKDAFHLVESAKYGGRFFITKDRRLLKKAPEVWAVLRLRVVKPSEFLSAYHSHSSARR